MIPGPRPARLVYECPEHDRIRVPGTCMTCDCLHFLKVDESTGGVLCDFYRHGKEAALAASRVRVYRVPRNAEAVWRDLFTEIFRDLFEGRGK